jgi:hypothetical protein
VSLAEGHEHEHSQPDAPANAGSPSRLHFSVFGPAWLRFSFDDEMNRLLLTALGVIGTVLVGGWLTVSLYTKSQYDRIRQEEFRPDYAVTIMDEKVEVLLSDVQSNWLCKVDVTNGPFADAVKKLTGKAPSVRSLIDLSSYKMPPYDWSSQARNRSSASLGLIRALFPPNTIDKKWHVSKDVHLAMLRLGTNKIYLYRDEETGLRQTLYVKESANIEPGGSANGSQPFRLETNSTPPAAGSRR